MDDPIPDRTLSLTFDVFRYSFKRKIWISWRWDFDIPYWFIELARFCMMEEVSSIVVRRPGENGGAEEWKLQRRRSCPELVDGLEE